MEIVGNNNNAFPATPALYCRPMYVRDIDGLKDALVSAKENKIVEIMVFVPRDKIMVKKQCKSFEEAVDSACSSLERQLVKKKEKLRANA